VPSHLCIFWRRIASRRLVARAYHGEVICLGSDTALAWNEPWDMAYKVRKYGLKLHLRMGLARHCSLQPELNIITI